MTYDHHLLTPNYHMLLRFRAFSYKEMFLFKLYDAGNDFLLFFLFLSCIKHIAAYEASSSLIYFNGFHSYDVRRQPKKVVLLMNFSSRLMEHLSLLHVCN